MQKKTLVATMVAVVMVGMAFTAMAGNNEPTKGRLGIARLGVSSGNGYGEHVSNSATRLPQ